MRGLATITLVLGLAAAGAAGAQAPQSPKPPYDIDKDPCGRMIKTYCAAALAKMDHPAIHACLLSHDDELTNACRMNMAPPQPPLRPEGGPAAPASPSKPR